MNPEDIARRKFIKNTATTAALLSLPQIALPQSPYRIRLEWQQFKKTPQYASYINAIRAMRSNTNAADRNSLKFWANSHQNYCPHGAPYFIAWHRGFLYYFEQQLRAISGDSSLNLPYWDYYTYPTVPSEFTNPSSSNPLYVARTGTDVYNALDLAPFAPSVWYFQRGIKNAFEPMLESQPHNPVHDLIGGVMTTMQSPLDPIFFLHHANIDRLTHAWALPNGKGIPYTSNPYSAATSSSYWAGFHSYGGGLTMDRWRTCDPNWLGYDYSNDNVPTSLPPHFAAASITTGEASTLSPSLSESLLHRPAAGHFAASAPRIISNSRRSLGSLLNVDLDENSITGGFSLPPASARALEDCLAAANATYDPPAGTFQSIYIVFDKVVVAGAGKNGGYFYGLYMNLPAAVNSSMGRGKYLLGTNGPFQAAGMTHHGMTMLEFPATELLLNQNLASFNEITLSCMRVNGQNAPKGKVMLLGEVRLELSTEAPWDRSKPVTPPGPWYP